MGPSLVMGPPGHGCRARKQATMSRSGSIVFRGIHMVDNVFDMRGLDMSQMNWASGPV